MNQIGHLLGLDDGSGTAYLFWSGIGADLSELAIVGALIGLLRKHNCHVRRCWRIGRFPVDTFTVCGRHKPGDAPTAEEVEDAAA